MAETKLIKSETYPVYAADAGLLNLSQEKLKDLGTELQDRYHRLKAMRERGDWERDLAEAFDAYHLVPPKKTQPYEGAANLRCVLTRVAVDSVHANDMYTIFGNGFTAKVTPRHVSKDFVLEAEKSADFLTYQLEHEADFYSVLDDADKKAHEFGIAYLEPRYCKQYSWDVEKYQAEEEVQEIDPATGQLSVRTVKKWKTRKIKRTIFDGVKIDSIPVEDIYASPFVRNLKQAVEHDVAFKKYRTRLAQLKLDAKAYEDSIDPYYLPGQVEKLAKFVTGKLVSEDSDLEQSRQAYDGFSLSYKADLEVLECAEAHLWRDIDGDGLPEKITVHFHPESGTVLRVALTNCRIVELKPRPIDERFYGESIYKAGKPVFDEWEAIHNTRVNAGQWENMPIISYNPGGRFNPEEVTLTPGHAYPMGQDVAFLQTPSVRSSYYQEEQLLLMYFERIFGLNENIQGVASTKEISATENVQVSQKASIRFANPMNRILGSLNELLEHIWDLNQKCAPKTKEYFITGIGKGGPVFNKMSKESYKSQLKFKLEITSVFDTQMLRDTWLLAFRMFRQDPLVLAHPAAAYDLFKNTLKGMNIQLDIPKPPQANSLSPSMEHELILKGQEVEPVLGEDYEEHLRQHLAWMDTEEFKDEWKDEQKMALLVHIDKTQMLKQTLESLNLNQSGMFDPGMMGQQMPSMTASMNPTQKFNNMRVGESGASAAANTNNKVRVQ